MILSVRVTPRGGADRIDGWDEDAAGRRFLKVRVRAMPEDGQANAAVERVLADALYVPARSVRVIAGHTARLKRVEIDAPPGGRVARQVEEWMGHERTVD